MRRIPERVMCERCGCCEVDPDCGCVGRCDQGDASEGHCLNGGTGDDFCQTSGCRSLRTAGTGFCLDCYETGA